MKKKLMLKIANWLYKLARKMEKPYFEEIDRIIDEMVTDDNY